MGMSYNEANNLINEGRRRSDGGSATLERNMMKMKKYGKGGVEAPPRKPDIGMESDKTQGIPKEMLDEYYEDIEKYESDERKYKSGDRKVVKAAKGKYMSGGMYSQNGSCRGMGAAIAGGKYKVR